jgi:hypothetical protein
MEVFLSTEAIQSFSALQCSFPNTNTDGFLIGHKRGDMFFVEGILPSQKGFFSSHEKYFKLKQKLEDKIIGFYSFQINESKLKKILSPLSYGKIFLRLDMDKTNRLDIQPFAIEHDKSFFLLPVTLKYAQ